MLTAFTNLQAQGFACTNESYCNYNLNNELFNDTAIAVDYNISYARSGTMPASWHDVSYDLDETRGNCNPADGCTQDKSSLNFDVYYPKSAAYPYYTTCPLPIIVFAHPGGFAECSSKENTTTLSYLCFELAKRGFIVFNIEYRRGRITYGTDAAVFPRYKTIYQQLAGYRAVQDFKGAIRSIFKMYDDGVFEEKFNMKKSWLFIGGQSAGAIAALNLAYVQKQDMADDILFTLHEHLGSINQNYYYADTTYAFPTISGLYCGWGSFAMPASVDNETKAATFFARNDYTVPFIAFQGKKDEIIPYDNREEFYPPFTPQVVYYSKPNSFFDTTTYCLGFAGSGPATVMPVGGTGQDLRVIGPLSLQQLVQNKGKLGEVYIDCEMGHGLSNDGTGYASNFGTSASTQLQTTLYMAKRIAIFFQTIITGTGSSGLQTFIECENFRHSCSPGSNHNNCAGRTVENKCN